MIGLAASRRPEQQDGISRTHAFRKWLGSRRAVATAVAPLIALTGVMAVATAAQAAVHVAIGTVDAQMANHRGRTTGADADNCINFSPNNTSTSSAWQTAAGEALAAHGNRYYDTACPTDANLRVNASAVGVTPTSATSVQTGTPFLLTKMTHYNNPIYLTGGEPSTTYNTLTGSHFLGNLNVRFLGSTFTYNYDLTETPNTISTPSDPRNDDFLIFENQIDETTLTIGGLEYRLVVIGFTEIASGTCPATPSGTYVNQFRTTEQQVSIGCLYAELSQVRELVIKKTVDASYGDPAAIPTFSFASDSNLASSPWETDFTLTPTALGAGGTVALPARDLLATEEQVTITEAVPPTNWELTGLTCSDSAGPLPAGVVTYDLVTRTLVVDNVPEVTAAAQSTITCTFTNTYTARGALTLVKDVDNTGGGTAVPANWDLTATPSGANTAGRTGFTGAGNTAAVTNQSVIAGEYSLSELGNDPVTDDYVQDGEWVCTGTGVTQDPDDPEIITISRDAVATCTVTNAFTYATLTLEKDVQVSQGSTAAPDTSWTLTATGRTDGVTGVEGATAITARPVLAGTYTLTEQGINPAVTGDYVWSGLTCTTAEGTPIEGVDLTNPSVTLAAGDDVTCTFTNSKTELTLTKFVSNGPAVAEDWIVSATPDEGTPVTGVGGATAVVDAATPYTLAETVNPDVPNAGSYGALYVPTDAGWTCTRPNDEEGEPAIAVPVVDGDVVVPLGTHVTCTMTNVTAKLTLLKYVSDPWNLTDLGPDSWNLTATPAATPVVPGLATPAPVVGSSTPSDANTLFVRPGHGYSIAEEVAGANPLAFAELGLEVYVGDAPNNPDHTVAADWEAVTDPASITVDKAGHAIYRFVNRPIPPVALPLTGGIGPEVYLLLGGLVLALALTAGTAHQVRTRRVQLSL